MDEKYTVNNYIKKLVKVIKERETQYKLAMVDCNLGIKSQQRFIEEIKTLKTVIGDLELITGKPELYSYWNE